MATTRAFKNLAGVIVPVLAAAVLVPLGLSSILLAGLIIAALALYLAVAVFGLHKVGSALMIVFFASVPWDDVRIIGGANGLKLSDLPFLAGLALLAPSILRSRHRVPGLALAGMGLFVVTGSLATLAQSNPTTEFSSLIQTVQGLVLLPLIVVAWQPTRGETVGAAAGYVFGSVVNVVASLLNGPVAGTGRYDGLTSHPNLMGTCAALSVALMPYLLEVIPRSWRWLVVVAFAFCAYGIYISGSRAALICMILVAMLYPVARRSIVYALGLLALAIPVFIVVSQVAHPDDSSALGRLLGGGSSALATTGREENTQSVLDALVHRPLTGIGWDRAFLAHNIYVQAAGAIGIIGGVALVFILVEMVRPLLKVSWPYNLLALPVAVEAVNGLVDPGLGGRHIWGIAALSLVAGQVAASAKQQDSYDHDHEPRAVRSL